ncbi:DUF6602 domain-containing protein [Sebaldella sp. S0638]|uniref:DUF6602 domain-containing protein n=1 Tax=Sebaldella sp. S0638 TaxID=2957809 RepID=UPI00209DBCE2|nr:DUF6602 domain-containing protein [Sebaldella sp. S0638]MCP1224809.1 hypothetical protein [Sebaldella sp. S0638]
MNENIIREIRNNYRKMEKSIVEELFITVNNHHLTAGTFREKVWKEMFENIIPKKFKIEQGAFLIDSSGKVSRETDLVIFDEQYIPYVLKNKNIKFIPIEAVMAVVQCKSNTFSTNEIREWEVSIDELSTGNSGIAGSTNNIVLINSRKTVPLKIICGTFYTSSEVIKKFLTETSTSSLIICAHSEQTEKTFIQKCKNESEITKNLYKSKDEKLSIYNKYNSLEDMAEFITPSILEKSEELVKLNIEIERFEIHELSLLTLVFQLNL